MRRQRGAGGESGQPKYLYNGKELQNHSFSDGSSLDWYDYGARFYDAQLVRFLTIDPLSEKYAFQSPFVYAANNPIKYIDWKGMGPGDPLWKSLLIGGAKSFVKNTLPLAAQIVLFATSSPKDQLKTIAKVGLPAIDNAEKTIQFFKGDKGTKAEILAEKGTDLAFAVLGAKFGKSYLSEGKGVAAADNSALINKINEQGVIESFDNGKIGFQSITEIKGGNFIKQADNISNNRGGSFFKMLYEVEQQATENGCNAVTVNGYNVQNVVLKEFYQRMDGKSWNGYNFSFKNEVFTATKKIE
jgi:RHS repeat-associated protein